jgi:hypothetical protein
MTHGCGCVEGKMAPCPDVASLLPRGCTDVICCVILLLAIVGYVAVGIIGK